MGFVLAIYGEKVNIGEALFISLFAMIVVFMVLLIISYLIDATAFFTKAKPKKSLKVKVTETAPKKDDSKSDNCDLVAVIAGALASYLGTSVDNIKIKSIRRVNQTDSPWTKRGLLNQINKI